MKKYAKYFKIDEEKAYLAGLLHDLAKDKSDEEIINFLKSLLQGNFLILNIFNLKKNIHFYYMALLLLK